MEDDGVGLHKEIVNSVSYPARPNFHTTIEKFEIWF